jgi:hypothetical protein
LSQSIIAVSAGSAKQILCSPRVHFQTGSASADSRARDTPCPGRLASIVTGSYSKAVRITVVISDKELGLSIVSILDVRNRVTELQKTLSERLNVARCPVEANALVILQLDRRISSLIEPKKQTLVMNHASDETAILPHGAIHGQPKPIHPEAQALLQIGTWYDWNAGVNEH